MRGKNNMKITIITEGVPTKELLTMKDILLHHVLKGMPYSNYKTTNHKNTATIYVEEKKHSFLISDKFFNGIEEVERELSHLMIDEDESPLDYVVSQTVNKGKFVLSKYECETEQEAFKLREDLMIDKTFDKTCFIYKHFHNNEYNPTVKLTKGNNK